MIVSVKNNNGTGKQKGFLMENKDTNKGKIEFVTDEGDKILLFVVEQTKVVGVNYLLVTDSEEDEAEAFIMKEVVEDGGQIVYEMVEDDQELLAVSKVFEELLDDIDIEMQ